MFLEDGGIGDVARGIYTVKKKEGRGKWMNYNGRSYDGYFGEKKIILDHNSNNKVEIS
jgi:hypothetical protein